MTVLRRRRPIDIWPAFVDAIASLLMVVIFVVLIAAVGQLFLSDAISGRDQVLARVNARVSELADLLSMQRAEGTRLAQQLALRTASLEAAQSELVSAGTLAAEQQSLLQERAAIIDDQRRAIALGETRAAALDEANETLKFQRDRLRGELASANAARDDVRARLAEQNDINSAARGRMERLNEQLEELTKQLAAVSQALEIADADAALKSAQIHDLGERLNLALAAKATELQRYRSEFFGRLRDTLGDHAGIRVVGDRFVLPSELLFESGSDALGPGGIRQIAQLSETLEAIAARIPDDLDWVLRIDGHTDRRPIATARFPSNWELSAARAITIVRALIRAGIPPRRLVATGFAEHDPIDDGDSAAAFARNRRIEIKLTSR